jgi:tRNA threonylcarbamoyladenosine biosynthesis protein TsaE
MRVDRAEAELRIDVEGEAETERLGKAIAGVVAPGTVIGLTGPLGAGKTRLVRAIAEALCVDPLEIASPTFVLIHEYAGRMPVFHFDTYRLGSPLEFEALGAADYFESGGVCLVEWADRVAGLLPADTWWLRLEVDESDPDRRQITVLAPPDGIDALSAQL